MNDGLRRWLPPILVERVRPLLRRGVYYSGRYEDFSAAGKASGGYDAELILDKVKFATQEVIAGRAAFERDSVLFREPQPPLPLLAGLLRASAEEQGRLCVLDYGGSLGSSYFQCRDYLSVVNSLSWNIVEQSHFVGCGREFVETEALKFYYSIDEVIRTDSPNVVLLASVLQYLPDPYAILTEVAKSNIRYLIIDRTPVSEAQRDVITVQHVPPSIYPASYPCRLFGKNSLSRFLSSDYRCIAEFDSGDASAIASGIRFGFGGMILRRT